MTDESCCLCIFWKRGVRDRHALVMAYRYLGGGMSISVAGRHWSEVDSVYRMDHALVLPELSI